MTDAKMSQLDLGPVDRRRLGLRQQSRPRRRRHCLLIAPPLGTLDQVTIPTAMSLVSHINFLILLSQHISSINCKEIHTTLSALAACEGLDPTFTSGGNRAQ